MQRFSVWMKRRRFRRSIARILCCRSPRDALNDTALSTSGTARCRCTRGSTPRRARCSARRLRDTRRRNSWRSWRTSVVNQPRGKEIHVIADNLSAHKTGQVEDFLDRHPKVHLHFTPTYSSWLNQIELWFAKIERDVIARGVFTSLADLRRKLMKYIRHYNKVPKTVKWRYFDPTRHITSSSAVTGH